MYYTYWVSKKQKRKSEFMNGNNNNNNKTEVINQNDSLK